MKDGASRCGSPAKTSTPEKTLGALPDDEASAVALGADLISLSA